MAVEDLPKASAPPLPNIETLESCENTSPSALRLYVEKHMVCTSTVKGLTGRA